MDGVVDPIRRGVLVGAAGVAGQEVARSLLGRESDAHPLLEVQRHDLRVGSNVGGDVLVDVCPGHLLELGSGHRLRE
eukprot:5838606-Heterocapsa_arctica.AAC.1